MLVYRKQTACDWFKYFPWQIKVHSISLLFLGSDSLLWTLPSEYLIVQWFQTRFDQIKTEQSVSTENHLTFDNWWHEVIANVMYLRFYRSFYLFPLLEPKRLKLSKNKLQTYPLHSFVTFSKVALAIFAKENFNKWKQLHCKKRKYLPHL